MGFRVKSIGSNGNYQLGLEDHEDHDEWRDVIELEHEPVVSCGGNHTIVLSGSSIYSCGDNSSGQCGIEDEKAHVMGFRLVPTEDCRWTYVACGWAFSLFCNDRNEVWGCGLGLNGELGMGKEVTQVTRLTMIKKFGQRFHKLSTSLDHVIIVLDNGDVYGWGNNKKQQLCQHNELKANKIIYEPIKLPLDNVSDAIVGRDFSLFRLKNGSFKFYGKDKFNIAGQLSLLKNDSSILGMRAMWSSVHLITGVNSESAGIISIGNNSHGQLFPEKGNIKVDKLGIGSEHGLIVSLNKVYAWGWGEHGNCGQHGSDRSRFENVTFDYLNKIYQTQGNEVIQNVYCGCATSWLILR